MSENEYAGLHTAEEWLAKSRELGFDDAGILDVSTLKVNPMVRDMCAEDKCHAYGHNWTCPPACGTLEECQERMSRFSRGILLQSVGQLKRSIDSKAYEETGKRHGKNFLAFMEEFRKEHPEALGLGAGGCLVCPKCAYPEPCRFPEKAVSSMEGYGLFVTQVCRDNGLPYYHGARTITYTACVLFNDH